MRDLFGRSKPRSAAAAAHISASIVTDDEAAAGKAGGNRPFFRGGGGAPDANDLGTDPRHRYNTPHWRKASQTPLNPKPLNSET